MYYPILQAIFFIMQDEPTNEAMIFIGIMVISLTLLIFFLCLKMLDFLFLSLFKRPAWVHFYVRKRKLTAQQRATLHHDFKFYNRLSILNKTRFEHRLLCFIDGKDFITRENFNLDEDKKLQIAATAVMLTFGMRNYLLPIVERIIVYPEKFYSTTGERYHKGEFNPALKTLVLSWADFEEGFRIEDNNLNLGIHEFTHAIHLNSLNKADSASVVFANGFSELLRLLRQDTVNLELRNSGFIREYAFTNEFEFLAVVLENFIESPREFKRQFPKMYKKIQQMFNFRFAGY